MVEVRNLTKKYGDHIAVDDISFTLLPGRIYGLLGPNGAGKSSTMNMMTGYIAPQGGTVEVDGHDIYKDGKAARSRIGYLPENPPLYQDMTVHEYLMFVAELKGVGKEERMLAVESVMEDTGVLDVSDKLIRSLSKGYRQRVGFAGAIVNDPHVVILDEPTVGLDPKQILEFRDKIRALGEDHIVLLSSHILSEIAAVCDHVFIINGGKLIVDDDVENLDKYVDNDRRFTIMVKGEADKLIPAVEALDGVNEASAEDANDGHIKLELVCSSDAEDITEQISLALMELKAPILEMKETRGSLEQIFLEITGEDPAGEGSTEDESLEGESSEEQSLQESFSTDKSGEDIPEGTEDNTGETADKESGEGEKTSGETADKESGEGEKTEDSGNTAAGDGTEDDNSEVSAEDK